MKTTITLYGGPLDGATAVGQDGQPNTSPGSVVHLLSGRPDGMVHSYEVRATDSRRADYLGDGYFGRPLDGGC